MPLTKEEQEARALSMYGMTRDQHEAGVNDYLARGLSREPAKMLALSILSDVQELLARVHDDPVEFVARPLLEDARQRINRCKSVIDDHTTDGRLLKRIQDALGTAEEGDALVEVARNAHRAEVGRVPDAEALSIFDCLIEVLPDPDTTAFAPDGYRAQWEHVQDWKATKGK